MKVFQYLTSLRSEDLESLYQDPWTCQAIMRALPPRAKQYIFKMLMVDSYPFLLTKEWSQAQSIQQHKEALKKLNDLRIISSKKIKSNEQIIELHPDFRRNIEISLIQINNTLFSNNDNVRDNNKAPSVDDLDSYSKNQWEKVLYYLSDDTALPSPFISELLLSSNLTRRDQDGSLSITSDGFKFLLKDVYTQIWTLLIVYLDDLEQKKLEGRTEGSRHDLLGFLFKLSFLQLGKGYLVSQLTDLQKEYLSCLRQFGLIYMKSDASLFFYPTRLIISLTTGKTLSLIQTLAADKVNGTISAKSGSGGSGGSTTSTIEKKEQGYIVLETNYRLYAYTSSSLQISLLSLFVKMLYRLPNLAVGIITRESIRTALIHGITADQIIDFIRHNAHPNAVNNGQPIPDVVAEQILLWEQERNRITYTKSVLYNAFPSPECYEATLNHAKKEEYYIWSNDSSKTLVAKEIGNESIRAFIKRQFA